MISIGDVLTLEPKYSDLVERYKCKLVEQKGNDLYIDYPINLKTNRTVFLLDGTQLKVSFVASDGSVYLFDTEVKGRAKQNIPMLILTFPGKEHLIKIQRRQFVRVETPMDIAIHPTNSEFKPFTGITEDISAGGAAVLVPPNINIQAGMVINTYFVLPMQNGDYHYLRLNCKVIRVIERNQSRNKVSLQFLDLTSNQRQHILRFSFERQLALKKKSITD
jgi:c-di-GMP-binding flagellar brake protein YcgR